VVAALGNIFPFRRARPGDQLTLERAAGESALRRFTYRRSAAEEWTVQPCENGTLYGEKRPVELTTEVDLVSVGVQGSLYESLQRAGEDASLAVAAAGVLAWDVDFYQDVRGGDRMKMLVEKILADGRFLRYGEVIAAEYNGSVTGRKRLFRYTDPKGNTSYFDDEGNSAKRGFLKTPLQYAAMTSRYGSRKHPVLGYVRAHQGVDYAAPTGTPVWAVAEGLVEQAGFSGGCGKGVKLKHKNGLATQYCHLSSILVRAGAHVSQKQIIGAVGRTGLATGPHLHYAVRRGGEYINPLSLKVPREAPLPSVFHADFQAKITPLRSRLDAVPVAMM